MKSRILICISAAVLFAAVVLPGTLTAQQARYTVTDLGTLGGTFSLAGGLNDKGDVEGFSTLPGDQIIHAFLWRNGVMTDLGTLGGPNSAAAWRPSATGEVGGTAEGLTVDPNAENFCGFGTNLACVPFIWQNGTMTALPTLGGNNGAADGSNRRGQLVGVAENTTEDATCEAPHLLVSPLTV